jgi:antitoxin MazE
LRVDIAGKSNYGNYTLYLNFSSYRKAMKQKPRIQSIKLVAIGNSKGVRLPKNILQKYDFSDSLLLEETEHGILLRPMQDEKLSWEKTYREMAMEKEDWQDFENTLLDGLDDFETKKV